MTNSTPDDARDNPRRTDGGSGIPADHPLMIGRSVLGRRLLDQLEGAGRANWTLLDNDALFSRNISNHVLPHVTHGLRLTGFMKYFEKPAPDNDIQPVQKRKGPKSDGGRADLIVDMSGDPSVRWMLASIKVARCASMFTGPTGNDSVLLLEDWGRSVRLDRLEPQYHRWLIHRDSDGATPPRGVGEVDPGVSGARPDAITLHAEALWRGFLSAADKPAPALIACRGGVEARRVESMDLDPQPSLVQSICGWRIVWDKGLETKVLEMRWKEMPLETGGVILGYADRAAKSIFIVDVCPAPVDSAFRGALFQRGARGVSEAVEVARNRTGSVVNYVGEWRSHPDAMFPIPGMDDLKQLARARDEIGVIDHPPVILIIGENDLMYHVMLYE